MTHSQMQKNKTITQNHEADQIISAALKCLEYRLHYENCQQLSSSNTVSAFLRLQLGVETEEVFAILFLTNDNRLIKFEKLFFGTINESVVYPRKVVKKCLEYNAAKIIVAHNHPSHNRTPSYADQELTKILKDILKVIDVQLLDHFIVTPHETYSFLENGLV